MEVESEKGTLGMRVRKMTFAPKKCKEGDSGPLGIGKRHRAPKDALPSRSKGKAMRIDKFAKAIQAEKAARNDGDEQNIIMRE